MLNNPDGMSAMAGTKKIVSAGNETLRMPSVFSDSMVLQRNKPVRFWGTALPGVSVTLSLNNHSVQTISGQSGEWELVFPPMKAGGPYLLKVTDERNQSLIFKDVLIGDVWLLAGQSNMNFILADESSGAQEMNGLSNPLIRQFRTKMPEGVNNPENTDHSRWIPATGERARNFSSVAYYFAKNIQSTENIPVGLIVMACGDTRIETWLPENSIHADPALKKLSEYLLSIPEKKNKYLPHRPGIFYQQVVRPVIPFGVKGIIWYQGESNALPDKSGRELVERAAEYKFLLRNLIIQWRKDREDSLLPFLLVQLPNFRYVHKQKLIDLNWALIRQSQSEVSNTLPNTGMIVTIDMGDSANIHPANKKVVGQRLASWALVKVYGKKNIPYAGPVVQAVKKSGKGVVIRFSHTSGKLVLKKDAPLSGFYISDESSPDKFLPATVLLTGKKILVNHPGIKNPAMIRYAWDDNPAVTLFNREGLPASPFSISLSSVKD